MTDQSLGKPPRRIRLGMVGGGDGAFIGAVHRLAARIDDRYEFVAGALCADPDRAIASGRALRLAENRCYGSYPDMAKAEAARPDRIDVVAITVPNHLHHAAATAFLDRGIHVICDKPLTTSLDDALDLVERVRRSGVIFALTHNYTGYPMVRQARDLVRDGALGEIRMIQVEYMQGWLATAVENEGSKQAEWRTDPARSGPSGCLGDIGTHAYNLASYVTGLEPETLAADLHTYVPGRRLDDNVQLLLRYPEGVRGMLWSSQVAIGHENDLRLRVYGDQGSLEWRQEHPNQLRLAAMKQPPQVLSRGGPNLGAAAKRAARVPAGAPEGYQEAFANLYTDIAEQITARLEGREPDPLALTVPTVEDGARAIKFVEATLHSAANDGAWTDARLEV